LADEAQLTTECGGAYRSLKLAWCTPSAKISSNQFPRCESAVRTTLAAVNSRPSACLSSFLLSGKSVLLEVGRSSSIAASIAPNVAGKLITHVLASHNNSIIYIHALRFGTSALDETLLSTEAISSNDIDHVHVSGFVSIMKECQLAIRNDAPDGNCTARKHLRRITRYFPLLQNSDEGFLFSVQQKFEPLMSLMKKEELSNVDMETGRNQIYILIGMEKNREGLSSSSVNGDNKNKKPLMEQYRMAFDQLAQYMSNYGNHSSAHAELLSSFLACSGRDKAFSIPEDVDLSLPTSTFVSQKRSWMKSRSSSPRSDSPARKVMRNPAFSWKPKESINLYAFLHGKYEERMSRWKDFAGRLAAGDCEVAPLYLRNGSTASV